VGDRVNRRHRPGRAFERTDYRFDVVTDYGAFRDLQRHRILTIEWQPLGTALSYDVPEVVAEAGLTDRYVASLERSRELYEALAPGFPDEASYAVALAYRIRYTMQMNAREAMHLLELRSGPQGHPSYRWVAQRCTARSASGPATACWPRPCPTSTTAPRIWSAWSPNGGPSSAGTQCRRSTNPVMP